MVRLILAPVLAGTLFLTGTAGVADRGLEQIRADAAAVRPLVKADCVRDFIDATAALPPIVSRLLMYRRETKEVFFYQDTQALPEAQRAGLKPLPIDTLRYYQTFYGSPLAYARPFDLCAPAGLDSFEGKRILDYGYGTIGHLRLLASCGAEAVGVDIDPVLKVLYSQPGDQGEIPPAKPGGKAGRVTLLHGTWPGTPDIRAAAGTGYDLFLSKNTLKNGYVHPPEGVGPGQSITLGVSDAEFVKAIAETVKPGGLVMIYNLGPAPAKEGETPIPMADIRCPFPRDLWESSGFEIVAFDQDDTEAMRAIGKALGWDKSMDLESGVFASYTLLRRKEPAP